MDRILKEERNYILSMIKKIRATGCNVLLIQKSILRDAVTDLSLHYLAKAKILVVKVSMGSLFSLLRMRSVVVLCFHPLLFLVCPCRCCLSIKR
jgi:chaperonin GroEL (HSP60 family)